MPHEAVQTAPETARAAVPEPVEISTSDIAVLAYLLWEERGCPHGSPEEDWLEAERRLKAEA